MVRKRSNKQDSKSNLVSQSITSSGVISSSTTSGVTGGGQQTESVITTTQQVPVVQKSTSSSTVVKSSSSTKVSSTQSSSQEQKFFSTSSSMSSSSKATKSGRTQQLQSESDAFLRGERTVTDIDAKHSKNGSILLESIDLHNVSSDFTSKSNLDNLVSIEIDTKGARAGSSASELVTNTRSTGTVDGNRNDAITVESGRKSGETTTSTAVSASNRDVKDSSSLVQGSSTATSSSTHQEFSSSSMAVSGTGIESKETKSTAAKNLASSMTMKNGQVVDNKNIADTTTTFTSKVFDDKTKTWVVVGQSSVNETDIIMPATSTPIGGASSSNKMNTMTISSNASGIDSTNTKVDSTSTKVDSFNSNSKMMQSDVQMNSKSTKEVLEKNSSTNKLSSRDEKIVSTSTSETMQVFDKDTKTWKTVDVTSMERPSLGRYRSRNEDGTWQTFYKRKVYDNFSRQWRTVDEKVVTSDDTTKFTDIPEMVENSTNMTTTTYTTKVYDTKTGKWSIVEEKSFVDTEPVNVTQDIKREIEKDQPDLANIITTTETTKVSKWNAIKLC